MPYFEYKELFCWKVITFKKSSFGEEYKDILKNQFWGCKSTSES